MGLGCRRRWRRIRPLGPSDRTIVVGLPFSDPLIFTLPKPASGESWTGLGR